MLIPAGHAHVGLFLRCTRGDSRPRIIVDQSIHTTYLPRAGQHGRAVLCEPAEPCACHALRGSMVLYAHHTPPNPTACIYSPYSYILCVSEAKMAARSPPRTRTCGGWSGPFLGLLSPKQPAWIYRAAAARAPLRSDLPCGGSWPWFLHVQCLLSWQETLFT